MKRMAAVVLLCALCASFPALAGDANQAPGKYNAELTYWAFLCQTKSSLADTESRMNKDAAAAYDDLVKCVTNGKTSGKEAYKKLTVTNPALREAAKNYLIAYMTFLDSLQGAPPIDTVMASDAKRKLDAASNAFDVAAL
jgi:hypothetical protein